ncbi:hypothetical protein [Patiriisocius sp. Uisw_017]|jgi:hypothetical protein|uniref:hypothetical protein n=1 Tax=Patiriisocius sp. Uisw_017 TaxID=3230968 RepID=UPI0039E8D30F
MINILISINALILSLALGTVTSQLSIEPHLNYPDIMILITNLVNEGDATYKTIAKDISY